MPLLRVENLSIDFVNSGRTLEVVRNVSFSLEPGEILALVGESGCGKSASCLSLTGLLPMPPARPRADRVLFTTKQGNEVDLFQLRGRELRRIRGGEIAYVFQEPSASLNPVLRIGDQIAEVLALHRIEVTDRRNEVIRLLRDVGISAPESRVDAFPHEMSGGMQQRVMIAMALAGRPRLLIADEPTTALDVTIQAQILELIDSLRRKYNMGVLLVTHNLGIVAQLADRVAVMYAGSIVESGPVRAVIDRAAHPYTKALLAAVPHLNSADSGPLVTIPGFVPSPENFVPGCRFFGRCALAGELDAVSQQRCRDCVPVTRSLENGRSAACHWLEDRDGK